MAQFNIPKLARNRYNYVKGADGSNYVTVSQMMMSSGNSSGSGGGGGTNGGTSHNQITSAVNQVLADRGLPLGYDIVSSYDLKTINGYSLIGEGDIEVTGSGTIDMSAYATKSYVADYVNTYAYTADLSAYVTHAELDNAGYTTVVQTTYDNYKNMSYAEKTNGYLYIVSDYEDTAYYITDEDLAYASYATTAYVESVKTSCYNYTDSKMSYSDVVDLINNMIDTMKQNGDLVDAAYVMSKVNGG